LEWISGLKYFCPRIARATIHQQLNSCERKSHVSTRDHFEGTVACMLKQLGLAILMVMLGCAPKRSAGAQLILPVPFSELANVRFGMSPSEVSKARPAAKSIEGVSVFEVVSGFEVIYSFSSGYAGEADFNPGVLEEVVTSVSDARHVPGVFQSDSVARGATRVCWTSMAGDSVVRWRGVRTENDEILMASVPRAINPHRRGVDTIPARIVMRWRKWRAQRPFESAEPC